MQSTIINKLELKKCWSADRLHGICYKCSRVDRCTELEAKLGRIINAKQHVLYCAEKLKQAMLKVEELNK